MCKQNNIPLIEVELRAELGEWLGQCKYDKAGVARRVRGCSSVAVKDYGEETEALNFVLNYIKENQWRESQEDDKEVYLLKTFFSLKHIK